MREFIEDELGEEGLARSVVVVATSDQAPLARRQAGYLTMAVAESFRDQGLDVLCMMDSVTRFAMAQREIGLAAGEPPATKGYTPSVFAELPRLLERAGPGAGPHQGAITGLFTVLVDGDDHNEPIADAVRGILDGHVVLSRAVAERGLYPAIDVESSVSRVMHQIVDDKHLALARRFRALHANYEQNSDLFSVGAYQRGADAALDEAVALRPAMLDFLRQDVSECVPLAEATAALDRLLAVPVSVTVPNAPGAVSEEAVGVV